MLQQAYPSFTWLNPTKVIFGVGELSNLPKLISDTVGNRAQVFLVTGRRSLRARGVLQRVVESIGQSRVTVFDQAAPFPSPDLVDEATRACMDSSAEIVVAIGGGSALDLAKCVAILTANNGPSHEFASRQRPIENRGLPFIAVPTTSGSSSEVTPGAALWDMDAKRVMGVSSPLMFPDVAIVDPELMMSMPKTLAAVTGMDAFTSAFESYWSTESEPLADAIDLEVIRMFAANLDRSSIQGDLESRSICALAATMSGIAYSNSHPNACHAVGGPLTLFWGVEHGQSVGISLTSFLRWAAPAIPHKMPALWNALGVADLNEAVRRITRIMERCGLKTKLTDLGIGIGDLDTIVENLRWERMEFLPRPITPQETKELLDALL